MSILYGILSLAGILFLGWLLSSSRKSIPWKTIGIGLLLQAALILFVMKVKAGEMILEKAAFAVQKIIDFSSEGIEFVFGGFYGEGSNITFVFAINVLAVIIFISALISALYYLRIIPFVVRIIGLSIGKLLGTTKVETFSAVGNSFLGLVEAPLLVRPYLKDLTRSELFAVMVGGTASASGAILVGYSLMGIDMKYLLISVFSVPFVSLIIAKLLEPETEVSKTNDNVAMEKTKHANVFEAIAEGAVSGVTLALNIGGLLIAFISILALINGGLGLIGTDLSTIFGYVFYPFAIMIGIPFEDAFRAASIIGTKLSVNEFVAYLDLSKMIDELDPKTVAILSIALCNFANLSSIGQLIVGLGSLEPTKRSLVSKLGLKAIAGGTLASFITAVLVGMFM
ncbi:NupC/NupG family nucleoside CNT transporter [Bacillus sp. CMF21]|uniref:NupC/NupG family nucleoside CNT transporter n=1 Tax=Metabacillus dongyingensis TaxID=2874282 RepID=UPI001CBB4D04|nr:nucleoside transporter C-terminal domain-containing protein [Metabacillus dongyingensis]UAL53936.1 NupC/NupG family nucleoside CNT transporter [Metabacillus dongyingensis]USK30250.1 NupC/NupG family nucleoside CNT transporter [Bacillus sp. CMF21]